MTKKILLTFLVILYPVSSLASHSIECEQSLFKKLFDTSLETVNPSNLPENFSDFLSHIESDSDNSALLQGLLVLQKSGKAESLEITYKIWREGILQNNAVLQTQQENLKKIRKIIFDIPLRKQDHSEKAFISDSASTVVFKNQNAETYRIFNLNSDSSKIDTLPAPQKGRKTILSPQGTFILEVTAQRNVFLTDINKKTQKLILKHSLSPTNSEIEFEFTKDERYLVLWLNSAEPESKKTFFIYDAAAEKTIRIKSREPLNWAPVREDPVYDPNPNTKQIQIDPIIFRLTGSPFIRETQWQAIDALTGTLYRSGIYQESLDSIKILKNKHGNLVLFFEENENPYLEINLEEWLLK